MRKLLIASAVFGSLSLGAAIGSVEAAPIHVVKPGLVLGNSHVEHVRWRVVCNRFGRHCHRVWVRGYR